MPSNFGSTPTSNTTLPANTFPVSAGFVPGTASGNLTSIQLGPASTDGNGYTSAPMATYMPDGNSVALGTTTDLSSANTLIGLTKAIKASVASVTIGSLPVLPAGSNTIGNVGLVAGSAIIGGVELVDSGGTNKASISAGGAVKVDASATTQPVSGTFWQATQPISAASLPLPSGGSTSAKQPALGTAGSASADVITVQGIASMTALKTDGSGVTQPVSGTFWQATQPVSVSGTVTISATNLQTNLNQIAGSNVATAATGIMKVGLTDGTGTALTSTSNALDVNIKSGGGSGFSVVDEAAWTAGTSAFVPTGGVFNDSAAALTSGQEGAIRLTNNRAIHVNLRDASANQLLGSKTSANSIPVVIASDQGAVSISGTVTANAGSGTFNVQGPVASGSANGNNPVKVGGVFNTTQPTVTNAQIVDAQYTARGAAIVATGVDAFAVNASQSGTWNITNVSGTVSLPTGAATSAKQPALGTAGSASADVITVQGIASMTALKVDGSAVTQPVSGTVTANQGGSNWSVNVAQIGASNVATAASGVQKVGIVGNAGATVDSTVAAGTAPTNAIVMGTVYNTSAPAPTNGQAMAIQADQAGNMRTFPGIALATLSAWSSGTSLNATQNIFTNSGAEAVLVQLTQTTTLTGGAITFEVSYDGSNWSTIPASAVLDPTSNTFAQISLPYTVQASTNKAILLNMNGAQALRIKLSTQITGTGTVTPNYALLPASPADTVVALSPTAANFNATVAQSGTWTVQPGNTPNSTAWLVQNVTGTSGGSTPSHTMSGASTNATSLKGSAGMVYGLSISNNNASARYFKLYNKASSPTVGTDTPILTLQIPANGTVIRAYPVGLALGTGIAWACTGGITDADTTSIGANDCSIDIDYK